MDWAPGTAADSAVDQSPHQEPVTVPVLDMDQEQVTEAELTAVLLQLLSYSHPATWLILETSLRRRVPTTCLLYTSRCV